MNGFEQLLSVSSKRIIKEMKKEAKSHIEIKQSPFRPVVSNEQILSNTCPGPALNDVPDEKLKSFISTFKDSELAVRRLYSWYKLKDKSTLCAQIRLIYSYFGAARVIEEFQDGTLSDTAYREAAKAISREAYIIGLLSSVRSNRRDLNKTIGAIACVTGGAALWYTPWGWALMGGGAAAILSTVKPASDEELHEYFVFEKALETLSKIDNADVEKRLLLWCDYQRPNISSK